MKITDLLNGKYLRSVKSIPTLIWSDSCMILNAMKKLDHQLQTEWLNVQTHWHQVILYSKSFLWAKNLHTMIQTAIIVYKQTSSEREGIVTMCGNNILCNTLSGLVSNEHHLLLPLAQTPTFLASLSLSFSLSLSLSHTHTHTHTNTHTHTQTHTHTHTHTHNILLALLHANMHRVTNQSITTWGVILSIRLSIHQINTK